MPLSMAACRTVLPFSTVTHRPSMVSVTVSITARSYQVRGWAHVRRGPGAPRSLHAQVGRMLLVGRSLPRHRTAEFFLDFDQRPIVAADVCGAQRAAQRESRLDNAIGHRDDHVDE